MATQTHWLLRSAVVIAGRGILCGASLLSGALTTAALAAPDLAPDLELVVSYETRQLSKSGVTRVETWQERMTRSGGTLWTERLLPARSDPVHSHPAQIPSAKPQHRHLDLDGSARWLQRDAAGDIQLRFVQALDKVVVSIPKAEFGTVGFDGRWDAAAYLVPPELVAKMKPGGAGPQGATWRVERDREWSHRVLWSELQQVALRIESRRNDGSLTRTVSVKILPALRPNQLPWQKLAAFEQKKYDDYMD